MRKRIISMMIILSVIFSFFNPGITTYADNLSDSMDNGEPAKVEREEVPVTEIEAVTSLVAAVTYGMDSVVNKLIHP